MFFRSCLGCWLLLLFNMSPPPPSPGSPESAPHNPGVPLDLGWIASVRVNLPSVNRRAATLGTKRTVKKQWQVR